MLHQQHCRCYWWPSSFFEGRTNNKDSILTCCSEYHIPVLRLKMHEQTEAIENEENDGDKGTDDLLDSLAWQREESTLQISKHLASFLFFQFFSFIYIILLIQYFIHPFWFHPVLLTMHVYLFTISSLCFSAGMFIYSPFHSSIHHSFSLCMFIYSLFQSYVSQYACLFSHCSMPMFLNTVHIWNDCMHNSLHIAALELEGKFQILDKTGRNGAAAF